LAVRVRPAEAERAARAVERAGEADHGVAAGGHRRVEPLAVDGTRRNRRRLTVGRAGGAATLAIERAGLAFRGLLDGADVVRTAGALDVRAVEVRRLAERRRAPAFHAAAVALDRAARVAPEEDLAGPQAVGRHETAVGSGERSGAVDRIVRRRDHTRVVVADVEGRDRHPAQGAELGWRRARALQSGGGIADAQGIEAAVDLPRRAPDEPLLTATRVAPAVHEAREVEPACGVSPGRERNQPLRRRSRERRVTPTARAVDDRAVDVDV